MSQLLAQDHSVLKSFIRRESYQYHWRNGITGPECKAFKERMFKTIQGLLDSEKGCNYIRILSITNMGLVSSALVLSAKEYEYSEDLILCLPSSPNGGVGIRRVPTIKVG